MSAGATRSTRLRNVAKYRVKSLLRRLGLEIHRAGAGDSTATLRQQLLERRGIGLVIDTGACVGEYASELRRSGYRGRIVSFEPLSGPYSELERASAADGSWQCRKLALGEREEVVQMEVAGNWASSSILPMSEAHLKAAPSSSPVGSEEVRVVALDDLIDEISEPADRLLLKIDVQGYEMTVLRGAAETLRRVEAIEIELSTTELYEGQPLLPEVLSFLSDQGFRCVSLSEVLAAPDSHFALQYDGLLVRTAAEPAG